MKAPLLQRLRKGWLGLALVMLAASLTVGAASASYASTSPRTGHHENNVQPGIDTTDATPRATCNYLVWWGAGVNIHAERDRESRIIYHLGQNTVLYGQRCDNREGGNYGSCGTGYLWKAVTYGTAAGWVATKCLVRV